MIKMRDILTEVVESELVIFVDLDGVLVDFTHQFKKYSMGFQVKDKQGNVVAIGDGSLTFEEFSNKYSKSQAWKLIGKAGIDFWEHMPWMSDGKQLWTFVNEHFDNVQILSAPSSDPTSAHGKIGWCKRELNPQPKKVNLSPAKDKQAFSKHNHILVDDNSRNVSQWREKGGVGVLHENTEKTIKTLNELLSLTEYSDDPFIGNMQSPIQRDHMFDTTHYFIDAD